MDSIMILDSEHSGEGEGEEVPKELCTLCRLLLHSPPPGTMMLAGILKQMQILSSARLHKRIGKSFGKPGSSK